MKRATVTIQTEEDVEISVYCSECGQDLEFEVDTGTRMYPYKNEIQIRIEPHKCEVTTETEVEEETKA